MRNTQKSVSDKKLAVIFSIILAGVMTLGIVAALCIRLVPFRNSGEDSSNISSVISSQIAQNEEIVSSSISHNESGEGEVVYESDDGTNFNVPEKMRAVYLKPGRDFYVKTTDTQAMIKSQLDTAMQNTSKLGFNSVVIFTKTSKGVLFEDAELNSAVSDFDVLAYALEAAKKQKLFTYVVYPLLLDEKNDKITDISEFTEEIHNKTIKRAEAFSKKYNPSAIIFDNYTVKKSDTMEASFEASKTEKSYEDFLREQVTLSVREARNAMRKVNKTSQIGILASGVWANASTDSRGSQTSSNYQSFVDGFADTREIVLSEKMNFVMVENLMPTDSVMNNFTVIAKWWSSLCTQADIPFFNVHASSKLHTDLGEFSSPDQLIRQVSVVEGLKTFGGSVFDSLSTLVEDKDGSTTLLLKYFSNQITDSLIFSKLKMATPTSNNVTTYDSTISFSGATDPNFKTTFNGQTMTVTEKGYFSYDAALKVGKNTFKISHKGKTVTYTVTRKVKLLESVTPTGSIKVDGETNITLTAIGYTGSSITAEIGNTTVKLTEKKAEDVSDGQVGSQYVTFEGDFKVPAAQAKEQNLGNISFTASWQDYSEKMTGATIVVFAKPTPLPSETASAVQITETYAETFPTDRLNDQSQPYCYPLPAGTVDYIVGNELTYTQNGSTYKYYKLLSGHRVYSKDVKLLGKIEKKNNEISAVNITFDGRFVNLKVDNDWSVPFKCIEEPLAHKKENGLNSGALSGDYKATKVTYRIFHTDKIDLQNVKMQANPLVSKVECKLNKVTVEGVTVPVCDIELTLTTAGGYFGAVPSYINDNKTLDVRLNTAAPVQKADNEYGYTLKGAVIIIDAGHDKLSPGASGVLMDEKTGNYAYPEYVMNDAMRSKVVAILKELGATVITVDNSVYRTAEQRFKYFKTVNPHLMISIHHNSSTVASAIGPIGTYFNSFSQLLCKNVMLSVADNYIPSGSNRANEYTFDRLKMTREQFYPSMLIECGFISNVTQQTELIKPENQQKIASQMVKGLINYFVQTGSLKTQEFLDLQNEPPVESNSAVSSDVAQTEQAYIDQKKNGIIYL